MRHQRRRTYRCTVRGTYRGLAALTSVGAAVVGGGCTTTRPDEVVAQMSTGPWVPPGAGMRPGLSLGMLVARADAILDGSVRSDQRVEYGREVDPGGELREVPVTVYTVDVREALKGGGGAVAEIRVRGGLYREGRTALGRAVTLDLASELVLFPQRGPDGVLFLALDEAVFTVGEDGFVSNGMAVRRGERVTAEAFRARVREIVSGAEATETSWESVVVPTDVEHVPSADPCSGGSGGGQWNDAGTARTPDCP